MDVTQRPLWGASPPLATDLCLRANVDETGGYRHNLGSHTPPLRFARSRGQAMVIDGLFFLMLCGLAAATLIWAGSTYGDKSFEAYRYIYMTDYTSGALQTLSQLDYEYWIGPNVDDFRKTSFLEELGKYMKGEYDEIDPRYDLMYSKWESLCLQAPAPLLLTTYTENDAALRGKKGDPLYWSCGKLVDKTWKDDKGNWLSLYDEETGELNQFKYPYYASPRESKSCDVLRCEMEIKIYY